MGHTRLGAIPKTRKWHAVVELMTQGSGESLVMTEDVRDIARAALDAAQAGLEKSKKDPGLKYAFYLLTQIVLAARQDNLTESLGSIGIHLPKGATGFDLACEAQFAIDKLLSHEGTRSDVAEIAQKSLGQALSELTSHRTTSLFDQSTAELQMALRECSTKSGFSDLSQKFFGSFVSQYLNFYLSRVTAGSLDTQRLKQLGDLNEFNRVLQLHCEQSARIIRDFSGDWYSKTEYQEGITPSNTTRFIAVAIKKIKAELEKQKEGS
jgi:hypothetical protein